MRMPNRLVPLPLPGVFIFILHLAKMDDDSVEGSVSVRNWKNIRERASSRQSYCLLKMPYFASHVTMAIIFIEPDQILQY